MIAALILTEVLSVYQGPFSELAKEFEKYFGIEETNFNVENKERIMKRFSEIYKDNLKYDFDGLTFDFEDWWFNVRPSNTEPKLRLNMEAAGEKLLQEKFKEISGLIKKEA
jgi:phosphomannomutase